MEINNEATYIPHREEEVGTNSGCRSSVLTSHVLSSDRRGDGYGERALANYYLKQIVPCEKLAGIKNLVKSLSAPK